MRWDKYKEQEKEEIIQDFHAKMAQGYEFKKSYAARRAWEFYNYPDVVGLDLCEYCQDPYRNRKEKKTWRTQAMHGEIAGSNSKEFNPQKLTAERSARLWYTPAW